MKFEVDKLQELVNILGKNQISGGQFWKNPEPGEKTYQLYDYIRRSTKVAEQEIKQDLYADRTYKDSNFHHLKNRLGQTLINKLLYVGEKTNSDYNAVYSECYKNFAAVKVLIRKGAKKTAIALAEETLKKARRFDLIELIYLLSLELTQHYSLIGARKQKNFYKNIYQKYFEIYQQELEVKSLFSELSSLLVKAKKLNKGLFVKVKLIIKDIKCIYTDFNTFDIYRHYYLAEVLEASILNNSNRTIYNCERAISYFDQLKFHPGHLPYFNFFYYLLPSLICTHQYEKASEIALRCLDITGKQTYNGNITFLYKVINHCHAKQYNNASEAFALAMKYPKEIPANIMEQWKIIEAYLYLLRSWGKLEKTNKRFGIQKFLNEVPAYSKDKTGANVSIIVIQILLLISRNERGKVIDRMDALRRYNYTYLRKDDTFRSQCFVRILLQLEHSHFNRRAFLRKTEKYRDKLDTVPLAMTDIEVEIIPYEHLYEMLVEVL